MPKIKVLSAEKAFLAAHGGPFDLTRDYIIISITDIRNERLPRCLLIGS